MSFFFGEQHKSESESFGIPWQLAVPETYGYGLVALNTYTCRKK